MKQMLSSLVFTPIYNFEKLLKLNILQQFELWAYNQGVLIPNFKMAQYKKLHRDVLHYNMKLMKKISFFEQVLHLI